MSFWDTAKSALDPSPDDKARKAMRRLKKNQKHLLYKGLDDQETIEENLRDNNLENIIAEHPNFLAIEHTYTKKEDRFRSYTYNFIPIIQILGNDIAGTADYISTHPHVNILHHVTPKNCISMFKRPDGHWLDFGQKEGHKADKEPKRRLAALENMAKWADINNAKHGDLFTFNAMHNLFDHRKFTPNFLDDDFPSVTPQEMAIVFNEGEQHFANIVKRGYERSENKEGLSYAIVAQIIYHYLDDAQRTTFTPRVIQSINSADDPETPQEAVDIVSYYYHTMLADITEEISHTILIPNGDTDALTEFVSSTKFKLNSINNSAHQFSPMLPKAFTDEVSEATGYLTNILEELPKIAQSIHSEKTRAASIAKAAENGALPGNIVEESAISSTLATTEIAKQVLRFSALMHALDIPVTENNLAVLEHCGYHTEADKAITDEYNIPSLLSKPLKVSAQDNAPAADDPVSRGYALYRDIRTNGVETDDAFVDQNVELIEVHSEEVKEGLREQKAAIESHIERLSKLTKGIETILNAEPKAIIEGGAATVVEHTLQSPLDETVIRSA